ncbi:MAG: fumarate hydratase, partial [Desulfobacteraceae bacterium]|nr:fumarate hydratase [Desulfobacteraceae bacterium]
GQDTHIVGGDLSESINEGVRQGYKDGYLRASSLDPLMRKNFGDNTPAIIHVEILPGDMMKLTVMPKGFGSENMSRVALFSPAFGIDGVKNYVVQRVEEAGANFCPPGIVGVGIGGTLEKAAFIAKKSLLRSIGQRNSNPEVAKLEEELLEEINKLGIGPQGLGGMITALDVHIETYPTHIGSLPVAVNLQCHCARKKTALL